MTQKTEKKTREFPRVNFCPICTRVRTYARARGGWYIKSIKRLARALRVIVPCAPRAHMPTGFWALNANREKNPGLFIFEIFFLEFGK